MPAGYATAQVTRRGGGGVATSIARIELRGVRSPVVSAFIDIADVSTNVDKMSVSSYVDNSYMSTYDYTVLMRIGSLHDLAAAIRGRRQELGLSQAQLAARAHVSRAWVNAFESGKPAAELRLVLAVIDALGLELQIGDREDGPSRGAAVDLDVLLDDYERP